MCRTAANRPWPAPPPPNASTPSPSSRTRSAPRRARLLIILRGKRLGFSLALIQKYLDLYDADPRHKGQLAHLLKGARQRIAELEAQRQDLEVTIEELREIEQLTLDAIARLKKESSS